MVNQADCQTLIDVENRHWEPNIDDVDCGKQRLMLDITLVKY